MAIRDVLEAKVKNSIEGIEKDNHTHFSPISKGKLCEPHKPYLVHKDEDGNIRILSKQEVEEYMKKNSIPRTNNNKKGEKMKQIPEIKRGYKIRYDGGEIIAIGGKDNGYYYGYLVVFHHGLQDYSIELKKIEEDNIEEVYDQEDNLIYECEYLYGQFLEDVKECEKEFTGGDYNRNIVYDKKTGNVFAFCDVNTYTHGTKYYDRNIEKLIKNNQEYAKRMLGVKVEK